MAENFKRKQRLSHTSRDNATIMWRVSIKFRLRDYLLSERCDGSRVCREKRDEEKNGDVRSRKGGKKELSSEFACS